MNVPDWITAVMPPRGPCGICGGPDARHRALDSIAEMVRAGDSVEAVADDFGYPPAFVVRVAAEWVVEEGEE